MALCSTARPGQSIEPGSSATTIELPTVPVLPPGQAIEAVPLLSLPATVA